MTIIQWKKLAVAIAFPSLIAVLALLPMPAQTATQDQPAEAATTYKSKCAMCHGQKAEKKFDATVPEDQMVEAILKGKKVEKPPNMPAYGEKGITADQAKALVAHMKSLMQ
jgi:mono/diheme cytochrome c family protein